jgi:endoglucanase
MGYTVHSSNEQSMIDYMNRLRNTWSNKGLGVVIGEYGATCHYTADNKQVQMENLQYWYQTIVSAMRERGFAGFVWDNNAFGNGTEKFGIFDRNNQMNIRAKWILNGILQAIPASVNSVSSVPSPFLSRPYFHQGRIVIRKGNVVYNLQGKVEKD